MEIKETQVFVRADETSLESVADGVQRRILGYDPNLMMTYVTFKKGSVGTVHHHPHLQVTYIESGTFEVKIGSNVTVLKAGDCFFVPPDVDHGVVAAEDGSLVDVFSPARADFLKPKD